MSHEKIQELEQEIKDLKGLLLWGLYHNQGGNSPAGQAFRIVLGIGQFEKLTSEQIETGKQAYARLKLQADIKADKEQIKRIEAIRKCAGDYSLVPIIDPMESSFIISRIKSQTNLQAKRASESFHVYSEVYELDGEEYELAWQIGKMNADDVFSSVMSVCRVVKYDWDEILATIKARIESKSDSKS